MLASRIFRGDKMLVPIILTGFITIFLVVYSLSMIFFRNRLVLISRLERIKGSREVENSIDELDIPFHERIIKPVAHNLLELISKAAPKGIKDRIRQKLTMAGNPFNIGVNGWIFFKSFFSLVIPLIFILDAILTNNFSLDTIGFVAIIIIMSFFLPNLIMMQLIKKRQMKITNLLPDVLDLLTVSVEAGLSFDGALARLVDKMDDHLTNEFSRVLNEMKMGKSRREALRDMSLRCKVPDLTAFIGSIIQAEELGVGITKVLRIQSKQMRLKRRQRAQEKAMKAPIKMLFPLIIFIFPAIFTVLLGPAVIRIVEQLGK